MAKRIFLYILTAFILGGCAQHSYNTRKGRKKLKHYNMHLNDHPMRDMKMLKKMKKKSRKAKHR